jgi:hypothetical protein
VQVDRGENEKLYGKPVTAKEILEGSVSVPESARILITTLEKYAPVKAHRDRSAANRLVRGTNGCFRIGLRGAGVVEVHGNQMRWYIPEPITVSCT